MNKKAVKGFFVVIIKQHDDTMFGADYHYTPWCIADYKYCRFTRTDKIRKFITYKDAQEYVTSESSSNTHDRQLEIVYLTIHLHDGDEKDFSLLNNWIQVSSEKDALDFDTHQREYNNSEGISENAPVFHWDSTEFRSIFKSAMGSP